MSRLQITNYETRIFTHKKERFFVHELHELHEIKNRKTDKKNLDSTLTFASLGLNRAFSSGIIPRPLRERQKV
jgi:hypothetical protein